MSNTYTLTNSERGNTMTFKDDGTGDIAIQHWSPEGMPTGHEKILSRYEAGRLWRIKINDEFNRTA